MPSLTLSLRSRSTSPCSLSLVPSCAGSIPSRFSERRRDGLHQQEFHFAPGAPGASEAPGAPSANRNSGCVVAYSFRPDAYPARPGAPDAPGCQPPASSIFSQPLTFVDVLSCLLSSSRTLLILAPLRLLSASSPPLIPFSLRIRPQSAPFPDAIHPLPYPSPFTP